MSKYKLIDANNAYIVFKSDALSIYSFSEDCLEIDVLNYLERVTLGQLTNSQFEEICRNLCWDSIALWKYSDKCVKVGTSLGGGCTYLKIKKGTLFLSKSENLLIDGRKSSYNKAIIRDCIKPSNRTLFSLTAFQNQDKFKNIVVPGMIADIHLGTGYIQESWYLDIENFCTLDAIQVEKVLPDILHDQMKNIAKNAKLPNTLMLSSGVDSALMAAAIYSLGPDAKKSFCSVNFCPSPYQHESIQAEYLAKLLDLPLVTLPEYGQATQSRRSYHFLDSYYNKFEKMHGYCHMTQVICNMDQAAVAFFGYHNSIGGTTGPTNLQIKHHLNYDTFLDVDKGSKAIQLAKLYRSTFQCKSNFPIKISSPENYANAIETLGVYSYLCSRVENAPFLSPQKKEGFYINDDCLINSNLSFILSKIKNSAYVQSIDTSSFDPCVAQKLLKLFTLFANQFRTLTSFRPYSLARLKNPIEPLMSSKITNLFLKTKIDDSLVENAKWPFVAAFNTLTGLSFQQIYRDSYVLKMSAIKNKQLSNIDSELERWHPFTQKPFYDHFTSRYNDEFVKLVDLKIVDMEYFDHIKDIPLGLALYRQLEKIVAVAKLLT